MPKVFNARKVVRERNFGRKNNTSSISTSVDANAVGHGVYAKPLTSLTPQLSASMLTYVYRFLKLAIMVLGAMFMSSHAYAQTVIYQDDFEGPVTGWNVNDTDFDDDTTNFLGRFANDTGTTATRTFTVPPGATSLEIEFDLYRFDSWDFFDGANTDGFGIDINGTPLFSTTASFGTFDHLALPTNGLPAGSGTTGIVDWSHTPVRGPEHFAFNMGGEDFWREQIHHFTLTVNNPGTSVTLTLRAELNQDENDESAGYDNFLVTAIVPTPEADLVTTKTLAAGSSATPSVGDTVAFDITVTNNGPDAAANVALSDTLPLGLTATGNNGTATAGTFSGGNWTIPSLANGASATLTLEGTVDAGEEGNTITNTLAGPATSDADDPSTAGDDLTEAVIVAMAAPSGYQPVLPAASCGGTFCLLYTSPSPRDQRGSRMPSSA